MTAKLSTQAQQFGLTLQFVLLSMVIAAGILLPDGAGQVLTLALLGVVAIVPVLPRLVGLICRALRIAPHAPPARTRRARVPELLIPGAPGTPGAAVVRAPAVIAASA